MRQEKVRGLAARIALSLALSACGGGESQPAQPAPDASTPAAFVQAAVVGHEFCDAAGLASGNFSEVNGQCMRASTLLRQVPLKAAIPPSTTPPITADMFLNWAESTFPQVFAPSPQPTLTNGGIQFRFYSSTQTYLAVANGDAFALGPLTGDVVVHLGSLKDFGCAVGQQCAPAVPAIDFVGPRFAGAVIGFTSPIGSTPVFAYQAFCSVVGASPFDFNSHIGADDTSSPIVVTGMQNGVQYLCQVNALNEFGVSQLSPGVLVAPGSATSGSAPGIFAISTILPLNASASIFFSLPPSNPPVLKYVASCTVGLGGVPVATVSAHASPITVTGLQNGTAYFCDVRAENLVGGSQSASVSVTPRLK